MNYWHIECYRKNKVVQQIDWNGNYENLVKMLRNKMIIYSTSASRHDTVIHYLNNYDYITINGDFYYDLLRDDEIIEEEPKNNKIEPINIEEFLQVKKTKKIIFLANKINEIIERIKEK